MSPQTDSLRRSDLIDELKRIAIRGPSRCFKRLGASGPVAIPVLTAVIDELYPAADKGSAEALLNLLRQTLERTIKELPDTPIPGATGTWRWVASAMYADPDDLGIDTAGRKWFEAIMAAIRERAAFQMSEATEDRNVINPIRAKLADVLLRLEHEHLDNRTRGMAPATEYETATAVRGVQRSGIEAKILNALDVGQQPVVLWGESGNGKSYLAREIARSKYSTERVIILRGPTEENSQYDLDLLAALQRAGHSVESWTFSAKQRALTGILAERSQFDLIILDNVDHRVLQVLPPLVETPTIITTQSLTIPVGTSIRIDVYSESEAVEAVTRTLALRPARSTHVVDEFDSKQASLLCMTLGRRPIAIDIAFRLVAYSFCTLKEMTEACAENVNSVLTTGLSLLNEDSAHSIVHVYKQLLSAIASDQIASQLLDTIVWLTGSSRVETIAALSSDENFTELRRLELHSGFDLLERLGLLSIEGDAVAINDLTLRILRLLTTDSADRPLRRFEMRSKNLKSAAEGPPSGPPAPEDQPIFERRFNLTTQGIAEEWNFYAWLRQYVVAYVTSLAAGSDFGMVRCGWETLFAWQRNFELFAESSHELQMGLISTDGGQCILWRPGMAPAPLQGFAHILSLTLANVPILDPMPGIGFSLFVSDDDCLVHEPYSIMSRDMAARGNVAIWSLCGKYYVPRNEPRTIKCARCTELALDEHTPVIKHAVLLALAQVIKRGGYSVSNGVAAATIYANLLLDNGHSPSTYTVGRRAMAAHLLIEALPESAKLFSQLLSVAIQIFIYENYSSRLAFRGYDLTETLDGVAGYLPERERLVSRDIAAQPSFEETIVIKTNPLY
jgi:hypothetical protein